jgi:hypothetical protein
MAGFINGTYAGFAGPTGVGSVSLADLAVGSDIVMDIWFFNNMETTDQGDDMLTMTQQQLVISMGADGMVSAAVTTVPIPGAMVLLGSGLLALVGIRRKNA